MSILQKITSLFSKKNEIEKGIVTLQKLCHHPTKSIKSVRERLDSSSLVIRYVCDECLLPIGYPDNEKQQNYLKQ